MKIKTIRANKYNYDSKHLRSRKSIIAIVIHYTANDGDTAENNGFYFRRERVGASANFFIDREGIIVRSVYVRRVAYAVETKGLNFKGQYRNYNTVSIELCDFNKNKEISEKQMESLRYLVKRIMKHCPNCKEIIRHFDVNGKQCPVNLINENKWKMFRKEVLYGR